jgi:hypothetical protein
MKDFAIRLTHSPGELADVTNALSLAGVNIRSLAAMSIDGQAQVRIIPDDPDSARNALRERNIRFEEHELTKVLLENKAGELTGVAARLAEAGLNLEAIYLVGVADNLIELAIVANNDKKAKKALADMAS